MLWYCRFRWQPHARAEDIRQWVVQQDAAGTNQPNKIRGWYNLAGGRAAFMLVETNDPQELTRILEPYMDLVSWDVHAVYELNYQQAVADFRRQRQRVG